MRQRSCPSGAPIRAAAAVAAVTPGTMVTSTPSHRPEAFSLCSSSTTALAMAKMPGSPDETMATSRAGGGEVEGEGRPLRLLAVGERVGLSGVHRSARPGGGTARSRRGRWPRPSAQWLRACATPRPPARVPPRPDDPGPALLIGSGPTCSGSPPWKSTARSPDRPGPGASPALRPWWPALRTKPARAGRPASPLGAPFPDCDRPS